MPKDGFGGYLRRLLANVGEYRVMRPWRHHLARQALWRFNRRAVSRGVGIGLFFGVLTPVAQIVFAVVAAIVLRANLLVAAGSTFITNPFTFPLIYYGAFRVGAFMTGPSQELVEDLEISEEAAEHALDVESWWLTLTTWFGEVGYPLLVGLFVLALAVSLIGYLATYATFTVASYLRRRTRRIRRPLAVEPAQPERVTRGDTASATREKGRST